MLNSKTSTILILVLGFLFYPPGLDAQAQAEPSLQSQKASFDYSLLTGSVETRVESVEIDGRGPYTVEVASGLNLQDKKRGKTIELEASYPKEAGLYPVIVFSHAPVASARDYRPFAAFWASHGYICISPTHADALVRNSKKGEKVSLLKLVNLARVDDKELNERSRDLELAILSLPGLPGKIDGLADKMDLAKIALAGHHAGAYSAQRICAVSKNIKAQLLFMGTNKGLPSISTQDWSTVTTPSLIVSFFDGLRSVEGQRDRMRKLLTKAHRSDFYLVTIDGEKRKRPGPRKVRRILKDSNIDLIGIHPLALFGRRKERRSQSQTEDRSISTSDFDHNEMPGTELIDRLGINPLNKRDSGERERFEFAMASTLPFLDAYLKEERSALAAMLQDKSKAIEKGIKIEIERLD